jgi:hypothetical protein
MATPTQVPVPSRTATASVPFTFVAATTTEQSIPWRRGDILIAFNSGASTRTVTIVNNPANSRSTGPGVTAENIAAGAYRVYQRFPAQDNDVLKVTANHAEVLFAVIGPTAHPA